MNNREYVKQCEPCDLCGFDAIIEERGDKFCVYCSNGYCPLSSDEVKNSWQETTINKVMDLWNMWMECNKEL